MEYNPAVDEVNLIGNWILQLEDADRPFVNVGTSSDRIFSTEGHQAYYITFAKTIPGKPISPYVSFSYSEFDEKILVPMGVNWAVDPKHDVLLMYDGRHSHLLATRKFKDHNLTLMAIKLRDPVFGISIGWSVK